MKHEFAKRLIYILASEKRFGDFVWFHKFYGDLIALQCMSMCV